MKTTNQISKLVLVGLLSLGSAVAFSACSQAPDETAQESTSETTTTTSTLSPSPVAEAPGTTASTSPSPLAQAPGTTSSSTASPAPVGDATTSASTASSDENIVEVATASGNFSTLTKALTAAGLSETLAGQGPYTVFAPTDEAFNALPAGTLDKLLLPENKEQLVKVLSYHVVPKEVASSEITSGEVATVEGQPLNVTVDSATKAVTVNDAKVTQPDIEASNGVIHVVDKVILPPDVAESLESGSEAQ